MQTASYAGQFGPDYAEKRRRMGPGVRFCRSDNAPQDGDSAEVAGATHSPPPSTQCRTSPSPKFLLSATQQRKQKTILAGLLRRHPAANLPSRPKILRSWLIPKRRESVVAPSAHLSSRGEMGAERLPAPKRSPFCLDAGLLWRSWARGCGVSGPSLTCVHRRTPHQTSICMQILLQIYTSFTQDLPKFYSNYTYCGIRNWDAYVSKFGLPFESTNSQIRTKYNEAMDRLPDLKWGGLTALLQEYPDIREKSPKHVVWLCKSNRIRHRSEDYGTHISAAWNMETLLWSGDQWLPIRIRGETEE